MKFYKLMWLPRTRRILWDIRNEQQIPLKSQPYLDIANLNFDLNNWAEEFGKCYNLWLDQDDKQVFDLNHDIHKSPIEMLISLNQQTDKYKVFHWFDINRDENPAFEWQFCPISKTMLKQFSSDFPSINRYFSVSYPLIFPG